MIINKKETLIRYSNNSFLVVIFRNGKNEKLCEYFINYFHSHCRRPIVIAVVGISSSLFASWPLAPCRQSCRSWRLIVVAVLLLSAAVFLLVDASIGFCA